MKHAIAHRKSNAAFTLVEVALALGVAGFCLVAVVGLVPLGVDSGQVASNQAVASSITTLVLADLRATPAVPATSPPGTSAKSTQYGLTIPANTPRSASTQPVFLYFGDSIERFSFPTPGSAIPPSAAGSRYRLTVQFLPAAGDRGATGVSLLVTWPAQIDPTINANLKRISRIQTFAALDRN